MNTKPLYVLLSALLAAGCSSGGPITVPEPIRVEVPVYETVPVPEALLQPCEVSLNGLETNQDLERALAAALLELDRCTQDKADIRKLE